MPCPNIQRYEFTNHARLEMQRRTVTEHEVQFVLATPEQSEEVRVGRCVYQSRVTSAISSKMFLIRVFVDIDRDPAEVVTVYRTSKIDKYWR